MLEALPNQKSYSGAMGLCDGGHFSPYVNGFLLVFTGSEQSVGRAQSNERKRTPTSTPAGICKPFTGSLEGERSACVQADERTGENTVFYCCIVFITDLSPR